MTQRLEAQKRPDVASQVTPFQAQMPLAFAGMGTSALKGLATGTGALNAAFNNVPASALAFSNPKGRLAQIQADKQYLGVSRSNPMISARTADRTAGGLKDVQVKKSARRLGLLKESSIGDILGRSQGMLSNKILPAAIALPVGVAGVAALDRIHRATSRAMDRAAEEGRFNRAMGDFDPAAFGDPSFQYRFEENPDEMTAALREAFGVLNRVAPSVAKDPIIAKEYMRRMVLDPEYRTPPEEYLRQVQTAVQLENQLQNAAPSLFDGIGASVGTLMPK